MNYAAIKKHDIANGPGVRVSLFVSGCTHHCDGCFNPETWDFHYGSPYTQETEEELLELFFSFLRCFKAGQPLSCPELPEGHAPTLPQLEQYCRKLDLYFSISKAFGGPIDRDARYDKREDAAESINQILLYNLKNNIRFCARCGAALPLHQSGRLCQSCYRKISALRRPTRW